MKALTSSRLIAVVAAGTLLTGCAGARQAGEGSARPQLDQRYMATIEKLARDTNTKIIWVNPPAARAEDGARLKLTSEPPDNNP